MDTFSGKRLRSQQLNWRMRRQGALIVSIPVICVLSSLIAVFWSRVKTLEALEQAQVTQQSLLEANRLLRVLVDAQTSVRGYGLTRNTEFLKPYSTAITLIPDSLNELNSLVAGDPTEQPKLQAIQATTQEQLIQLEQTLDLLRNTEVRTTIPTELTVPLAKSRQLMDTLRQQIAEFSQTQERQLSLFYQQERSWRERTSDALWLTGIASLVGGGAACYLFDRLERELQVRETGLQESRIRVQAVFDNAADGILTLSELGEIQSFNPAAEQIFGCPAAEAIAKNFREFLGAVIPPEATADAWTNFVRDPRAKLMSCQQETVGKRADGSLFSMDIVISQMQLNDQLCFIAICRDITERIQADELLRKQAQLLDLANDTIIVRDLNDVIVYWNQGAKKLYGWSAKEAIGQSIHTLLQTDFPQPLAEIQAVFLRDGYWEGQLIHTTRQGEQVIVSSRWTAQRDENRQAIATLEINNDVTERQRWIQALRESEERLRLVMDSTPQYIFWKDQNSVYQGCNENVAQLFGFSSPTEIVGRTDYDLPISSSAADRYRALDRQIIQTNQPQYHVIENLSWQISDRAPIWIDASRVPLTDGAGNVNGILYSWEDITERREAEAALAASEQRFRATFEQAAVGMAHIRLDGRCLMVNQKLCEILGYDHKELLARNFQEITHPADLDADLEYVRQLSAGEIQNYSIEKRCIHKNGQPIWINLTVSLVKEAIDKEYMIAVIEDIRERRQVEEAVRQRADELANTTMVLAQTTQNLKKRNQELDQFAYVVSHDLKAPLRAIANLSTWIEEDLEGHLTRDTQHQMNLLRGRVHRMEALIEGLLQYSRIGRISVPLETVSVAKLLGEVIDSLAPPPHFTIQIQPGMPTLVTQRLPLAQVFSNLIGNGIKHNPQPAGHVKISVNDQEDFYEFSVADNGLGIAPQYHEKVFVIFSTLEARDKVENTGIGLALVKKIVENQGGTVRLESQPGQGATFYFQWPKVTQL